jgi:outer membrane biosynthesis protein TonB
MRHHHAAVVLAIVLTMPALAAGDPKGEAKERIAKATELHKASRFAEALDELNVAYTLDPQPEILYAIGQLNVKLGNCEQAILFYERYLGTKPPRATATKAKKAIKVCKTKPPKPAKAIDPPPPEPPPEPPPADDPPPPPPAPVVDDPPPVAVVPPPVDDDPPPPPPTTTGERRPFYTDVIGDVLVVGGVGAGVAAALFYRGARADLDAAEAATRWDDHDAHVADAHGKRTIAMVLGAGAVILTGAGIVRFVTGDRRPAERRGIAIVPGRNSGFVTWTGVFR